MKTYEGSLVGTGLKIAVVVGRFNEFINERLLDGAVSALKRHGVDENDIEVVWVPGAYEIPLATKKLAETNKYDDRYAWLRHSWRDTALRVCKWGSI